jgi:AraC-like DNA-binding protein
MPLFCSSTQIMAEANQRVGALGTTFGKILDEVRFEITCEMLRDTDMAVIEIAAMLGYVDASAFTRAFRRWSGITPAQWRFDNRAS